MFLPFTLGTDPATDEVIRLDLAELPHLLVAGTTGSGKSVFLNSLLNDLLVSRVDCRYMLIDPKRVEFMPFKPFCTVYTDEADSAVAIAWLADHMEERFEKLERHNCRDIETYNASRPLDDRMPRIVLAIDELANLMLGPEQRRVELPLTRLAQMSRAVGIHLVLATQRPTVDVVTGLLKANIPGRVSFAVISQTDSRVILDEPGAEELLGKGQMLARIPGLRGLRLLQGQYIDIAAVEATVKSRTEVPHGTD
jgi:S-DNA-T family DNA segregation ATPase FtsK/SpoIIIE